MPLARKRKMSLMMMQPILIQANKAWEMVISMAASTQANWLARSVMVKESGKKMMNTTKVAGRMTSFMDLADMTWMMTSITGANSKMENVMDMEHL